VDLRADASTVSFETPPVGTSSPGHLRIHARIWNNGGIPISGVVRFYAEEATGASQQTFPIRTDTVQVESRAWGDVQIPWNVADLPAGEHILRIHVAETLPVESDTTNNQTVVTYALPLTLSSMQAEVSANQVRLRWITEEEWQNQGFHLYRAIDTKTHPLSYRRINPDLIPGAKTSTVPHTYAFVDTGVTRGISYAYTLTAVTTDGREIPYRSLSVTPQPTVLVSDHPTSRLRLPTTYALRQNRPNPFNQATLIEYELPERVDVVLTIYDVLGREMQRWTYRDQEAGYYRAQWDGKDEKGETVSSGIYLYRLRTGTFMETRRMIRIR